MARRENRNGACDEMRRSWPAGLWPSPFGPYAGTRPEAASAPVAGGRAEGDEENVCAAPLRAMRIDDRRSKIPSMQDLIDRENNFCPRCS